SGLNLGKTLRAREVIEKLGGSGTARPKLFVRLPPPIELRKEFKLGSGTQNDSIRPVESRSEANYYLAGRWRDKNIEYAWVRPDATKEDAQFNPLPVRTDWFAVADEKASIEDAARELELRALRIGRLKSWLTLGAAGTSDYFPYRLALK